MAQKTMTEKQIEELEDEMSDNLAIISDLEVRNNKIRKILAEVA